VNQLGNFTMVFAESQRMRAAHLHRGTVLFAVIALQISSVLAGGGRNVRPVWTTDLKQRGYSIAEPPESEARLQIAFGSMSELVVINDQGPFAKPNPVKAFVLDTASGAVVGEANWVTSGWPFVFATATGSYVAVTDKGMVLHSPGLKQIIASTPESARHASPDGRIVAAWSAELKPGHGLTLFLDTENLKPAGVEVLDTHVISVSRNHAAYIAWRAGNKNPTVFYLPEDDELHPYDAHCAHVRPWFISQDLVALFGCGELEVINSTESTRVFGGHMKDGGGLAAVARDGSRFATIEASYSRSHSPILKVERFTVFDVRLKGIVFNTEIKELRGRERGNSGAALSPDGSLLAINSLGVVNLYALQSGQ